MMRTKLLAAAATLAAFAIATPAAAQEYKGTTTGCFVIGGVACSTATTPNTDAGLLFTAGSFDTFTNAVGQANVGGGTILGVPETFGLLTLGDVNHVFGAPGGTDDMLNLVVNLTLPGNASTPYTANLIGAVSNGAGDSLNIDWLNPTQTITAGGQTFTLTLDNFSMTLRGAELPTTEDITGHFTAVPEPATWAMMLLGFGGMGLAMRRRRRPVLAQIA